MKFHVGAMIILSMFLMISESVAGEYFKIGIAPHTSARVILEMYQPLRVYLTKNLGMPVEILTATNFDEYIRRALQGEFDIAITTGHQARLLQSDASYIPLLTYKADFKAIVIVAKDGQIHSAKDLREKNVLGLSPTSLVTMWGQHWLSDNGSSDIPVKYVSASDSVAQLVASGDAAAGFTSLANFQRLPNDLKTRLAVIAESKPMAGRVYLLNKRQSSIEGKISSLLWSFAETPEARSYFTTNELEGYRMLKPNELEEMDIYAAEVRKSIKMESK